MNDPLTDSAPSALVAAMEANQESVATSWGRLLGKEFHVESEQTWFCSGFSYHLFNGVIRTQLSPEHADDAIKKTLENFRQRGVPFAWLIGPSTQPADLPERLERHGLRLDDDSPGMVVDILALPEHLAVPDSLQIIEVTTSEQLRMWL